MIALILLLAFDFSYYAERPRIPMHIALIVLPAGLATARRLSLKNGKVIARSFERTLHEWGVVVLLADALFYLFPYGYVRALDYAILIGSLLVSFLLISMFSLVRPNAILRKAVTSPMKAPIFIMKFGATGRRCCRFPAAAKAGSEAGNLKFTFSVGVPFSAFSYIPEDFQERNAQNMAILMNDEIEQWSKRNITELPHLQ